MAGAEQCGHWGQSGGPICGGPTQEAGLQCLRKCPEARDHRVISLPSQPWLAGRDHQLWAWGGQLGRQGVLPTGRSSGGGQSRAGPSFQVIPGKVQPLGSWMSICQEAPKHTSHAPPPAFVKSADEDWGQDGGWLRTWFSGPITEQSRCFRAAGPSTH